jgi:hypothetical protein
MDEKSLQRLIEDLAPLNNRYRLAVRNREPAYVAINYLWDIGDVLVRNGVGKVHPVARKVQECSYITASLLSYAFRVRRYFRDRRTIGKVPNFSVFRDAFPLLENPRYNLSRREKSELVRLLNSGAGVEEISTRLTELKRAKRPRRDTRTRPFEELQPFASLFRERLRDMEALMESAPRKQLHAFRESFTPDFLLLWARLAMCFADEAFAPPSAPITGEGNQERWVELVQAMHDVACRGKHTRNRVRKLVKPMEFLRMAEFVDILRDKDKLEKYVKERSSRRKRD